MEILLQAAGVACGVTIVLTTIVEIASRVVYGKILSEEFLDRYFTEKRLNEYVTNHVSDGMFYGGRSPLVAQAGTLTSTWYIYGVGRIPRWSKYHKTLSKLHEQLLLEELEEYA